MARVIQLESDRLTDFFRIVDDWRGRWQIGERAVYRGHTDCNWLLIAKLFRDPGAKAENRDGDNPQEIEEQLESEALSMEMAHGLERRLLHDFSRYLYAYRPDLACTVAREENPNTRAVQEWRQLALAQHYGLPTRFLDFTTNILVALFFAVEDPVARRKKKGTGEWLDQDSAVWCIEVPNRLRVWEVYPKREEKGERWLSPLELAEEGAEPPIANFVDNAYVPEHIDGRIPAQGSVFMCEPRGKKLDWQLHRKLRDKVKTGAKETETLKVIIPRQFRESLCDQLDLLAVNRSTLFPDLGSAARYLAWSVHQRKRPYGGR